VYGHFVSVSELRQGVSLAGRVGGAAVHLLAMQIADHGAASERIDRF
jgi:hypothetical protein